MPEPERKDLVAEILERTMRTLEASGTFDAAALEALECLAATGGLSDAPKVVAALMPRESST